MPVITFVSCFYIIKSKFPHDKYIEWFNNIISIVNNFNLVIYVDENTYSFLPTEKITNNTKIKIIIKPIEQLYNYKYKNNWIDNHNKNDALNSVSSWELNMLWSEKTHFVNETVKKQYFVTDYYGWCDIGYFRNRLCDLSLLELENWPNNAKIMNLDKNKIYYGCISNDTSYIQTITNIARNKKNGVPIIPIPSDQTTISGGFFVSHKNNINWLFSLYDITLTLYFANNYLVKDDQIILADCIFNNLNKFTLIQENSRYDRWFMFQRFLL